MLSPLVEEKPKTWEVHQDSFKTRKSLYAMKSWKLWEKKLKQIPHATHVLIWCVIKTQEMRSELSTIDLSLMLPKWFLVEHERAKMMIVLGLHYSTSIMGRAEAHYARARSSSFVFQLIGEVGPWPKMLKSTAVHACGRRALNAHAGSAPIRFSILLCFSLAKESWLISY